MVDRTAGGAEFEVAIVGFGPCGAVLAGLLGKRGVRTFVVDRLRTVYDKPRAFALDHEIMRVFQSLGVAEAVSQFTAPFTASEYYGVDGRLIKRLGSVPPPWPQGWPPNVVFTQPPVEEVLRATARECASVRVSLGEELTALAQDAAGVTLTLRDESGKQRNVRARYAVGCDGATSTVRRLAGLELDDLVFDEPWLVVDVMVNEAGLARLPKVSAQHCNPSRPATYLIGPGAHRRWEIMLLPGEDRARFDDEAEVWKLLAPWIGPSEGKLWRHATYRFHALVARQWRAGRVLLAGDAAHQQPPFTGQGMCQGVRDVANLEWKLARVLNGTSGEALLDSYGEERGTHVRRLTTTIKEIGRVIGELDPVAARARDERLIAEAGGEVRTVPRQHLLPPLERGVIADDGHRANGTLFPQPRLVVDGRDVLMDEKAGKGFLVVLGDAFAGSPDKVARIAAGLSATVLAIGNAPGALRELDGVMADWFAGYDAAAALVRPDRYVFGVAKDEAGLARLGQQACNRVD